MWCIVVWGNSLPKFRDVSLALGMLDMLDMLDMLSSLSSLRSLGSLRMQTPARSRPQAFFLFEVVCKSRAQMAGIVHCRSPIANRQDWRHSIIRVALCNLVRTRLGTAYSCFPLVRHLAIRTLPPHCRLASASYIRTVQYTAMLRPQAGGRSIAFWNITP
jgi:hypothetical protein